MARAWRWSQTKPQRAYIPVEIRTRSRDCEAKPALRASVDRAGGRRRSSWHGSLFRYCIPIQHQPASLHCGPAPSGSVRGEEPRHCPGTPSDALRPSGLKVASRLRSRRPWAHWSRDSLPLPSCLPLPAPISLDGFPELSAVERRSNSLPPGQTPSRLRLESGVTREEQRHGLTAARRHFLLS